MVPHTARPPPPLLKLLWAPKLLFSPSLTFAGSSVAKYLVDFPCPGASDIFSHDETWVKALLATVYDGARVPHDLSGKVTIFPLPY